MTSITATVDRAVATHIQLKPLDPNSPAGQAAAKGLAQLLNDIADRLEREGQPLPDRTT